MAVNEQVSWPWVFAMVQLMWFTPNCSDAVRPMGLGLAPFEAMIACTPLLMVVQLAEDASLVVSSNESANE